MSATGASFARGKSEQIVETPADLLAVVTKRWGSLASDLAANAKNSKAPVYLGPGSPAGEDALAVDWRLLRGNAWLNPGFGDMPPWVLKCADFLLPRPSAFARIILLCQASVGANYWRDFVHNKALVVFLNGRVKFVGHTKPFPKDLALCVYGDTPGYEVWDWRRS